MRCRQRRKRPLPPTAKSPLVRTARPPPHPSQLHSLNHPPKPPVSLQNVKVSERIPACQVQHQLREYHLRVVPALP